MMMMMVMMVLPLVCLCDCVYVDRAGDSELPWSFQYGLDDDSEGGIAVNILPLVLPSRQLVMQQQTSAPTTHAQ